MQATLAETPATIGAHGAAVPSTAPTAAAGPLNAFVINLVSSTTPVALTRPDHAGLKRFTFFVSRRLEDGRERFRLHMGYFDTQQEAEQLLDIVRTIYPGAWAGLAPGRRLGAAAARVPAGSARSSAAPASAPADSAPASGAGAPASPSSPSSTSAPRVPRDPSRSIEVPALALVPDEGRRALSDVTLDLEQTARAQRPAAPAAGERYAEDALRPPTLSAIPELKPAVIPTARPVARRAPSPSPASGPGPSAAPGPAPAAAAVSATPMTDDTERLTHTATLRLLETGSPEKKPPVRAPRAAVHEDKSWYAVQLVWSVQQIAMAHIPQLAIFSAYTLYGAEGNRDGRRWYGLRLGFFTDAVSAKQVAHYVRGDFATVSVVPVTMRERDQALQAVARATTGTGMARTSTAASGAVASGAGEANAAGLVSAAGAVRAVTAGAVPPIKQPQFTFIEGDDPLKKVPRPTAAQPTAGSRSPGGVRPGGRPTRGAPGKRAKQRPPGQIHARSRARPKTLEETLEILGAGELHVEDDPAAALLNDSGVRHLKLEAAKAKPSKLSRLIERLSERMGN